MRNGSAFTLVEMLVVTALLAILFVLLFPVTATMRDKADDAKCIANLRNSSRAMLNYFQDQNGRFFPGKYWFQYSSYNPSTSLRGMREYFGVDADTKLTKPYASQLIVDTMLTCPAMTRLYSNLRDDVFRRGYGVNHYLFRTYDGDPVASFGSIYNVSKPGAMWMISDGAVPSGAGGQGAQNHAAGALLGSINRHTANHATQFLAYPHGHGNQFAFADGHVERLSADDLKARKDNREFWGDTSIPE